MKKVSNALFIIIFLLIGGLIIFNIENYKYASYIEALFLNVVGTISVIGVNCLLVKGEGRKILNALIMLISIAMNTIHVFISSVDGLTALLSTAALIIVYIIVFPYITEILKNHKKYE